MGALGGPGVPVGLTGLLHVQRAFALLGVKRVRPSGWQAPTEMPIGSGIRNKIPRVPYQGLSRSSVLYRSLITSSAYDTYVLTFGPVAIPPRELDLVRLGKLSKVRAGRVAL